MKDSLRNALEKALSLRSSFPLDTTNAFRLFVGEGEGIPGVILDRYHDVLVMQIHDGTCALNAQEIRSLAVLAQERSATKSVYLKRFVPDRSSETAGREMYSPTPFAGEPSAPEIEILENGVRFVVKPYDGFSTGIFLDQRENRRRLAEDCDGKEVFNGFSYTCAFSVYCALRGAKVTSVDLSKKYLAWGKRNFEVNGVELAGHRFVEGDVFSYLGRDIKKGRQYDLVILDPPSFSRNPKGDVFSLKKDLERLMELGLAAVKPGGRFFFSCNLSSVNTARLKQAAGTPSLRWETIPASPLDFARQTNPLSAVLATVFTTTQGK